LLVALRFAFVGPMIVDDGKFHLFESWRLTRGRFGSLFLIALGVFGILLAAELVIGAIIFIGGGAAMVGSLGGLDRLEAFFRQPPTAILAAAAPFAAVFAVLMIP